ncbi:hypothetical protein Acsp01_75050 [Actinoplanes sp. NBRC 101535]|nr:hypothetical protein Acsp01_75050 [Actinoplanes sp. NBRC 101535]
MIRAATLAPDQVVVHVGADGDERTTRYADLYADALRIGAGLHAAGLRPGDPLLLLAEDSTEFLPLFWGAIVAGVVPVPLPPEPGRLAAVRRVLGDVPESSSGDLTLEALRAAEPLDRPVPVTADDLAFLQFSSGSTGDPKGVELTHGNLAANVRQAAEAAAITGADVVLTWMPYFHDMGLIGTHLVPMHVRCRQVRIAPLTFAKRPETWLRAAERHRATVLSAANFALALTVRRVRDDVLTTLDLSCVRLVMVGAEPISPAVWRAFADRLGTAGLRPETLQPVYGLAEATVAVAFAPAGELAVPVRLSRAALARGVAVPSTAPDAVEFMDVGHPVPGCRIRVTDDTDTPLEDGLVGNIQVSGPNVTRGYHRAPDASAALRLGEWLRTGDIGYLRDGRLVVTGRAKDVLFVHGRTFHAADLEEVAAATPGLGTGPVAVVGATDPASGRERVVVFVAAAAVRSDPTAAERVRSRVAEALAYDGVSVQVVPSGAFARTTSGKLRRQSLRDRITASPAAPDDDEVSVPVPAATAVPGTRAEMLDLVRAVWARVLRVPAERIGDDDRFLAIGGSSLAAMEVLAGLEDAVGRTLEPVLLRDGATVTALADRLLTMEDRPAPVSRRAAPGTDLAVIGMACRFPDADTPDQFWANLLAGRDSVTTGPRPGAFLADPSLFDAGFFGIPADEARHLDPHARIFLELAHEALERAGYAGPRRHAHRIGVFAAVGESGYPELTGATTLTGVLRNLTAARVAHLLDLRGPAVAIDTACSSALVALHYARLSLAAGDCDIAVVGGVNLLLTDTAETLLGAAQALSPTGRCRAFDADADGFVPGEGGAAIVLTRLGQSETDQVLAVVRGTAVNNDGRSLSLLAPNPLRQREVIVDAYRQSGVDPAEVGYVEAHGTGTAVGDPIEVRSLAHAFAAQPLLLGSVKTNIGHLLNAAGMPALLKVILALRHGELPPSLHHHRPSPHADLAGAGFTVVTSRRPWSGTVAAVNSFGFGGTNAHAILAAAPGDRSGAVSPGAAAGPHLVTVSARSAAALRVLARELAEFVRDHPEIPEADIGASASTARDDAPYRIAVVADGDLAARLAEVTPAGPVTNGVRVGLLTGDAAGQARADRLLSSGVRAEPVTDTTAEYDVLVWCGDGEPPVPRMLRAGVDTAGLLATVGELWLLGAVVDRTPLDARTRRVPVPVYPFQRRRYWVTDPPAPTLSLPRWREAPIVSGPARGAVTVLEGSADVAGLLAVPRTGHLLVVTENLHATDAETAETADPAHAVLAGLAMALADESPELGVRIVDVSTADTAESRRAAVERERSAPPVPGPAELVAWRAGRRLARTFVPVGDEPVVGPPAEGAYLITGGAGAVGAAVARHLARRGQPTLLLAGRSAEPSGLVEELRGLGATVEYRVADITVPEDVAALVDGRTFDVVVHAAGVVRPGSLSAKTPAELAAGMSAKVRGTSLLAAALSGQDVLFVALSSVSTVLPALAGAVGDYVAGNLFLDAFATAQRATGRRFVAVNLPALTGAGMAASHRAGGPGLPVDHVPEVLWSAAALAAAQVLVTPSAGHDHPAAVMSVAAKRPEVDVDAVPLTALVLELLGTALNQDPASIGADEPFLGLGLDSLTAVDLVKELETRLGRTLSTTLFFEHPTTADLVRHLAGEQTPGPVPLSPVQRAFVTTGRLYPDVPAYAAVRQTLAGPVDAQRLGRALGVLERRHPMLRTRLDIDGQRTLAAAGAERVPEWFTVAEVGGAIEELDRDLRNRPFDLSVDAPVRVVLATDAAGVAHLLFVAHHAVADGYSLAVLGDELWALYAGRSPGAEPATTFADHEAMRAAPSSDDREYWRNTLDGYPRLVLPVDGEPGGEPRPPYLVHQVVADPGLTGRLEERARAAGVTVFHLLLAGYARCLARWSGQDRVPIMVARAGREARLAGVDRMVGPFADTLPVLAEVTGEPVTTLAGRLRDAWLASEQHGSVSSVDIARLVTGDGAGPRTVSPAGFSFARFPGTGTGGYGGHVVATTAATASAATRLSLVCFEAQGALHFSWNHPAALFTPSTVARLAAEHLEEIIALAASDDAATGTGTRSIVDRIREQCARTPDGIAVLTDGVPLKYQDLDRASADLAGRVAAHGAGRVGLLTGPGAATVAGVVGILRAGAAWVPLDAAHPTARLVAQLTRAGATVVVADASTREAAAALGPAFIVIDALAAEQLPAGAENVDSKNAEPGDDAYVIFTSGSTGRPKGVPISHRAMANYLDWAVTTFGYHAGDRLAQTASICFDASVRQILAPLLVGATVVAWDRDTVRDPGELLRRVERDRITVWSSVPTLWERLLTEVEKRDILPDLALRWVHVGGEELSPEPVRRWFDLFGSGQRISNLYGPTETTINATFHVVGARPDDGVHHLPIGRPVGGATVAVIGADGQTCADGEIGELWIGGTGLADGYLDDPEQTAAVFVERAGRRWYRSGDRAVRDADGLLWFRGRADDQVKLHGYRVEPGEVQAVLRGHPAVDRAAVRVDGGRLVAWVQPRDGHPACSAADLRNHLAGLLPAYLVPATVELVTNLPLTATGKIDRAALVPVPVAVDTFEPPVTAMEHLLAGVWERQLGRAAIGRRDDWFALGGDSIGVLEMFTALEAELSGLPRPTVVYSARTLQELAAVLETAVTGPPVLPSAAMGEDFPLSASQRGFLLADAMGAPSTWLATPRLHGPLDRDRFQQAVDAMVDRHPMLRVVVRAQARPPMQRVLEPGVRLTVGWTDQPRSLAVESAAERAHGFDLDEWPLLRMRVLRYGPQEHVLLLHAHHLIGDGYSVALLARDLLTVYDGGEPAPLRSTFRDYVALLERDRPIPAPRRGGTFVPGVTSGAVGFTVGAERVRQMAAEAGTTPFAPVLAAFGHGLRRVGDRADVVVGVAVTGRDHSLPDLGRIFGPCATAVAVEFGPGDFPGQVARTAAAVTEARTRTFTAPQGWQYFFTYLDFAALGDVRSATLRLSWEEEDAELSVPPGTDVLLAARPVEGGGLRLTLRGRVPREELSRIAAEIQAALTGTALDAALIGYLPSPEHLSSLGLPSSALSSSALSSSALSSPALSSPALSSVDRETIRETLFPGGVPRLLEVVDTPLGRSGFVALPRFADELAARGGLAAETAAAVDIAAAHGARSVSLAGMIPAFTGYATTVVPLVRTPVAVTTGHAVTAASVVRTTLAALDAAGRSWSDSVVAILGVGSIGASSLSLLLARAGAPAGLILCDLPSAGPRLTALASTCPGPVEVATDGPDAVYRADVIVAATSGGPGTLDVDRLRPGTILVDDSFPHCFDPVRALARMRSAGDVLVVGGGLLDLGAASRTVADGLPAVAASGQFRLPGAVASCQTESLLHATTPGLPAVCGPVTPEAAAAYWAALDAAGVRAAPLHLLSQEVSPRLIH